MNIGGFGNRGLAGDYAGIDGDKGLFCSDVLNSVENVTAAESSAYCRRKGWLLQTKAVLTAAEILQLQHLSPAYQAQLVLRR